MHFKVHAEKLCLPCTSLLRPSLTKCSFSSGACVSLHLKIDGGCYCSSIIIAVQACSQGECGAESEAIPAERS